MRSADNTGIWPIGGSDIDITANTEFKEDHDPLVVGICVEVECDTGKKACSK